MSMIARSTQIRNTQNATVQPAHLQTEQLQAEAVPTDVPTDSTHPTLTFSGESVPTDVPTDVPTGFDNARIELCRVLSQDNPTSGLWAAVHSGFMDRFIPEISALNMAQDPQHRHKDVLAHSIAVTAMTSNKLVLRLAALFHDVGKPRTRSYSNGEVTFRYHEAVGARMTRKRLSVLKFEDALIKDVSELVRLSGRFKGYNTGWSDSAVRRYARDAGHLLGLLNELVRADCTTRHAYKRARLHEEVDSLERRIASLAAAERKASERPQIDGVDVMRHLGIGPGPHVGEALAWLLEMKRSYGELDIEELYARLDRWWESQHAV